MPRVGEDDGRNDGAGGGDSVHFFVCFLWFPFWFFFLSFFISYPPFSTSRWFCAISSNFSKHFFLQPNEPPRQPRRYSETNDVEHVPRPNTKRPLLCNRLPRLFDRLYGRNRRQKKVEKQPTNPPAAAEGVDEDTSVPCGCRAATGRCWAAAPPLRLLPAAAPPNLPHSKLNLTLPYLT